jgi:hypothetical protein
MGVYNQTFGFFSGKGGGGGSANTIYTASDTIISQRNVGLSTFDLTFGTSIFAMQGANGRVGVGTATPYASQVRYPSTSFNADFVVRTNNFKYGLNHNDGVVEIASYIDDTDGAYWGTTTNHDLLLMINDGATGVIKTGGNWSIGATSDLSARLGVRGVDSTGSNFAFRIENSSAEQYFLAANNKIISAGGLYDEFNSLFEVDGATGQIRTNAPIGFYDSEFLIRSNDTNNTMFHVTERNGSFTFTVEKDGSNVFGQTWGNRIQAVGMQFLGNVNSLGYGSINLGEVPRGAQLSSDVDISSVNSYDVLFWATSSENQKLVLGSDKGLGYATPYFEAYSQDDPTTPTISGRARISSIGNSFVCVNTIGGNDKFGVGTETPTSKIQVVGLPTYADNAAALADGLTAGAFYIRTGHGLDIVV